MTAANKDTTNEDFTIEYGAKHGDSHFGKLSSPKKSQRKSKWTISKDLAIALMKLNIHARMGDIKAAAAQAHSGGSDLSWILIADAKYPIGIDYRDTADRKGIKRFQIQLQVPRSSTVISFHGFPDGQTYKTGLGPVRNSLTENARNSPIEHDALNYISALDAENKKLKCQQAKNEDTIAKLQAENENLRAENENIKANCKEKNKNIDDADTVTDGAAEVC